MYKVFIDGSQGTTGLRLRERLASREDIELISLPESRRKDLESRVQAALKADIAFLCLPDDASREIVSALEGRGGCVIDASTAHRTDARFAYGFPELGQAFYSSVRASNRIAVPGCHASGAVALIYPLIASGALDSGASLSLTSLTGYSGGGKSMIAEYESEGRDNGLASPRVYALTQRHKHLPEIAKVCALSRTPVFMPIVAPYYSGMLTCLPLQMGAGAALSIYENHYKEGGLVRVARESAGSMLAANAMSGRDDMLLFVAGNDERAVAYASFDNLGKGASGAAIQCMNIRLGLPARLGLNA